MKRQDVQQADSLMRVLFVHPNRDRYGEDTVLLGAIQALDQDHTIAQVALCPSPAPSTRLISALAAVGIPTSDLQNVTSQIQTQSEAVWNVTVSVSTAFTQGAEIARRTRTSHVWLACDAASDGLPLVYWMQLVRSPAHVVVASQTVYKRLHVPRRSSVSVLPYSLDASRWMASHSGFGLRDAIGCPLDAPLIGAVGPFDPVSASARHLTALFAAVRQHERCHCLLTDVSPQVSHFIDQHIGDASVRRRVHLLPAPASIPDVYAAIDIFAAGSGPSTTQAIHMLEAMMSARPVVALSSGDELHELIDQGETGWVVGSDDYDAYVDALLMLANDSVRRESMGLAGRNYALQHHSWEHTRADLISILAL